MEREKEGESRKKGLWTAEEDEILMEYVRLHGKGKWNRLSKSAGLRRSGKSCRMRWVNHLSPGIKRSDFSEEEDDLIIRLHSLLGNRWSLIAGRVPGRTDNQVKNHWNTRLSKRLKAKSITKKFGATSNTYSKEAEGSAPQQRHDNKSVSSSSSISKMPATADGCEDGINTPDNVEKSAKDVQSARENGQSSWPKEQDMVMDQGHLEQSLWFYSYQFLDYLDEYCGDDFAGTPCL